MKLFVTGGTGFIGHALIQRLAEQGHEIRVLTRRPEKLSAGDLPGILPVVGDLSNLTVLRKAMEGCYQVYHLAALAQAWAPRAQEFDRSNIEGTRNLLEAARHAGAARVVHTSTVMVIGPTDGFVANESRPIPTHHLSHYQRTKAAAEREVAESVQRGLSVVTVSPSLVYGPGTGERRNSFNRFLHDFLTGRLVAIPGDGSQFLNCAYLDDVVSGHLLAMERGRIGERYILGGENISVRDLVCLVNEVAGLNRAILHIPFWVAGVAGLVEQIRARLTGCTPLLTRESVEIYRHSWAYSSDKAIRELGYQPRGLREGLELTVRWLRKGRG
jgi:nucleoside-diphosphate-sugar epimerase